MIADITIESKGVKYRALIKEEVTLTQEKEGYPTSLEFSVINDGKISFFEGDLVELFIDYEKIFEGYVFSKSRKTGVVIDVIAYDQLRYLKNSDTIKYSNMKASDIVIDVINRTGLKAGTIEDTKYVLEEKIEENSNYFDIIYSALNMTKDKNYEEYILFDDCGVINLKNVTSMKTKTYIDKDCFCDYSYKSSIDEKVFNSIKVVKSGRDDSEDYVYDASDLASIEKWGLLQNVVSLPSDKANGQSEADILLVKHNKKYRKLSLHDVIGEVSVRAGSLVMINLDLGDVLIENKYMIVDRCTHKFFNNGYFMDLEVSGDVFDNENDR